jgi:hypothetical protein
LSIRLEWARRRGPAACLVEPLCGEQPAVAHQLQESPRRRLQQAFAAAAVAAAGRGGAARGLPLQGLARRGGAGKAPRARSRAGLAARTRCCALPAAAVPAGSDPCGGARALARGVAAGRRQREGRRGGRLGLPRAARRALAGELLQTVVPQGPERALHLFRRGENPSRAEWGGATSK